MKQLPPNTTMPAQKSATLICIKGPLRATPGQFRKLFLRSCTLPLDGYVRLVVSVLEQAVEDAQASDAQRIRKDWDAQYFLQREEIAFWLTGQAGAWGQMTGLDPDFVREIFVKHSGIPLADMLAKRELEAA
jgi:hypothetical protein